jgi:hypothetical protein
MYPVYIPSNGVGGIASLIDDGPIVLYIIYNINNNSYKNKCVQK